MIKVITITELDPLFHCQHKMLVLKFYGKTNNCHTGVSLALSLENPLLK